MKNSPIGIFDSGIGGLTVAHAITKVLPNENIIYFGDTEHLPYGEKSKEAIQIFSRKIIKFLIEKNFPFVTHGRTELFSEHPYFDNDHAEFINDSLVYLKEKKCDEVIISKLSERLHSKKLLETSMDA